MPDRDDNRMPRAVNDDLPVMALLLDLGPVGEVPASGHLLLAYDDVHSITYFRQNLRPYWRRDGAQASDLLKRGEAEYEVLAKRCRAFDDELMADLRKAGGEKLRAAWPPWPIASALPPTSWRPMRTGSPCSSPRRTSATAVSLRST